MKLEWEYTRTYKMHHAIGENQEKNDGIEYYKFKIEACLCRYGAFHEKEDGYDLLKRDHFVAHGLTVKELKLKAQEIEDLETKG
jgi:hypothetical protein